MAMLKIVRIECKQTQENGEDEIYITVNRKKIWGPKAMNESSTIARREINKTYNFKNRAAIRVYEEDGGLFDDDDWLSSHTAQASDAEDGEKEVTFAKDGANYKLIYEVYKSIASKKG